MDHYVLTAFTSDSRLIQLHLEIDPTDRRFDGPIKCTVSASSRNFWIKQLQDYDVQSVSSIKQLTGSHRCHYRT